MTPETIAQWVIENRYPKSENEKVSDSEMYHTIVDMVNNLKPQISEVLRAFKTWEAEKCRLPWDASPDQIIEQYLTQISKEE